MSKRSEEDLLKELAKLNEEIAKATANIPQQPRASSSATVSSSRPISSSATTVSATPITTTTTITNDETQRRKRRRQDDQSGGYPPAKKHASSSSTISAQPVYNPELLAVQKQQAMQDYQIQQQVSRAKQSITNIFDDKGQLNKNKRKKAMRTAAGETWEDPSLLEWPENDHRIFVGNLGNDVTDEILAKSFSVFPSFQKARVVRDKRTTKSKGYGFVSFADINDFITAMESMDGKYIGNRPCMLKKSNWGDRNQTS